VQPEEKAQEEKADRGSGAGVPEVQVVHEGDLQRGELAEVKAELRRVCAELLAAMEEVDRASRQARALWSAMLRAEASCLHRSFIHAVLRGEEFSCRLLGLSLPNSTAPHQHPCDPFAPPLSSAAGTQAAGSQVSARKPEQPACRAESRTLLLAVPLDKASDAGKVPLSPARFRQSVKTSLSPLQQRSIVCQ
jgi:hypothetical protein